MVHVYEVGDAGSNGPVTKYVVVPGGTVVEPPGMLGPVRVWEVTASFSVQLRVTLATEEPISALPTLLDNTTTGAVYSTKETLLPATTMDMLELFTRLALGTGTPFTDIGDPTAVSIKIMFSARTSSMP
jgi:hypothetical protein